MPSDAQKPFENPLTILSEAGHRRFGKVIRQLAREAGDTRPDGALGSPVLIETDVATFRARLTEAGMVKGVDYAIAEGVCRIEFVTRRPNIATFLLPDPAALNAASEDSASVLLPRLVYERAQADPSGDDDHVVITRSGMGGASGNAKRHEDGDPFDDFLDVHMSSYMVAQCL